MEEDKTPTRALYLNASDKTKSKYSPQKIHSWIETVQTNSQTNEHIFPDEGSIAETSEFYLQLSAFNLPPSHF